MRTPISSDAKCVSLRQHGTLNPHPERVKDALFQTHPFFDPRDIGQVKYEMLRRVLVDGQPVGVTAANFGFSRVTLYQLRKRFEAEGLAGLLPQPKGPRRASKLSEEVLAFVLEILKTEPDLRTAEVPQRIAQHFGLSVHVRSIERALTRSRKKG
jgi:transposase